MLLQCMYYALTMKVLCSHHGETVNVDKIKHIFIVLVLATKSVFKH
jgi:hypothetical protein